MFPLQPWSYLLICITTTSTFHQKMKLQNLTRYLHIRQLRVKASVICKYLNTLKLDSLLREMLLAGNCSLMYEQTDNTGGHRRWHADSLQAGKQTSCFTGVVPGWGRGVESRAGGAEASLLAKELLTSTPNGQVYTSTLSLREIIFTSLQVITWTHLVFTSDIK